MYIYIYIYIYTFKKMSFKFLLIDGGNYCCSISIILRVSFFVLWRFLSTSSVFLDIVMWDILLFAILVPRCLYHWKKKWFNVTFHFTSYEDGLISWSLSLPSCPSEHNKHGRPPWLQVFENKRKNKKNEQWTTRKD